MATCPTEDTPINKYTHTERENLDTTETVRNPVEDAKDSNRTKATEADHVYI